MEHIKNILGNLGNSQVESKDISDDEIMKGLGIGSQGVSPQVSDDEILKGLGLDTGDTPSTSNTSSPKVGFLDQAAAVVPGVVSGARQGLSGALKTLAYADTYDRENILKSPSLPGDDFSQAQELVRDLVPENTRPMADHPLWKHAQKSDARERKDYPVRPGTELTHSISQGLGQVGMMAGTGAVPLIGAPLAILQGMGLSQGEALDDATKHKADIEQLRQAGQAGAISGLLEYALPFKLLKGFNKIKQGFGKEFLSLIGSGSTEAIQEALQQLTLNYAAKDIGYDEKRELTSGLKEAAGVGGAVGLIAHLAARSLGIKLDAPEVPKTTNETTPSVETPEVDTPELAKKDAALVDEGDQDVVITKEQRKEFFQLANKYKGYENIPDNHPIYEEMDEDVVLKLAQEYDARKPKAEAKKSLTKEEVDLEDSISAVEERIEQKTKVLNDELNKEVRDEDYIEKLHDSIDKETDRHKKSMEKLKTAQKAKETPKVNNKLTRYEVGLEGGDTIDISVEELPNGRMNITNNDTGEVTSIAKNIASSKDVFWLLERALAEGQKAESFSEAETSFVENFNEGNEEVAELETLNNTLKALEVPAKSGEVVTEVGEAQIVEEPKVEESVVEEPKAETVSEEPVVKTASKPKVIHRQKAKEEAPTEASKGKIRLYRGTTSKGLQGREGYATFATTSKPIAQSFTPHTSKGGEVDGEVIEFEVDLNGKEIIEFPVTKSKTGSGNTFDRFEFDKRARTLTGNQVLIARNVYDTGPHASTKEDPDMGYSYPADQYAFPSANDLIADLPEEGTNVEEAPSPVEPSVDQDKLESQIENFTTGQKNLVRRLVGVAQNEYQKAGHPRDWFERDYDDSPEEFVKLAADTVFGKEVEPTSEQLPTRVEQEEVAPKVEEYSTEDEARRDYELNPRSFPTYEAASKFAEVRMGDKKGGVEVIKVKGKYRIGESKSWKSAKLDYDKMMEEVRKEAEKEIEFKKSQKKEEVVKEVIKVKGKFTKLVDGVYVAQVNDDSNRQVAIVKRGEKDYEALLGTAQQIQTDTAEPIGQFPSLIKAKRALGDKGVKATKKAEQTYEQLKEYLQKEIAKHKKKQEAIKIGKKQEGALDREELARLIEEQEADMRNTSEELEDISLSELDEEGEYFTGRDIGDSLKDIYTLISSDERGAINPEKLGPDLEKEIKEAKQRLKKDAQYLGVLTKRMVQKVPNFDSGIDQVKKLASILLNQDGYINIQGKGLVQAWREFTKLFINSMKAVRRMAKSMYDWAVTRNPNTPSPTQQQYTATGIKGWMKDIVGSWKLNSSQAVNEMHDFLIKNERIVPEHDGKSRDLFARMRPMIRENIVPRLKAGVEKVGNFKYVRSPSHLFSNVFDTVSNPIVDAFESIMSLSSNVHNSERWIRGVLDGIEDSSEKVKAVLDPLYAQVEGLVEARRRQQIRVESAKAKYQAEQDQIARKGLWSKWKHEAKLLKKHNEKIKDELILRYDSKIADLATAHADVRILLQAADQLPAGINLSQDELNRADKIREYFDTIRGELQRVGIPVKSQADFMHRVLPDMFRDKGAHAFMQGKKDLPRFLKFTHQAEEGRLWYPSAHITLNSYTPLVERKLAFQPFLNRWHDARAEMPKEIGAYFDEWLEKNLYRQPYSQIEKFANGLIAFEYMRIIGGSLSVAFKHATKAADTLAIYDSVTNIKAINLATSAVIQRAKQALGIKGRTHEIELMKTYITAKNLVKMLDETPGMTGILNKTKMVLGSPTMMTEFFDNGISILATTIAASRDGMTQEFAHRKIWETVLNANFRGQFDQPFLYKATAGRTVGMFQVTPSKLLEYRAEMIYKAFKGERDAFGTLYMTRLVRYILLFGMAESIARAFGNTIIDQVTHLPFFGHLVKGTKSGYKISEPTFAKSPPISLIEEMNKKGTFTGFTEHFLDLPTGKKFMKTAKGEYSKNFYDSPISSLFGIYKLGSGSGAKAKGNARRNRSRRASR